MIIIIIPASVLENDIHKLLWDFDIQMDHVISAGRPDQRIINNKKKKKRICNIVDFAVPADHRIKLKVCEKKDRELKKLVVTQTPVKDQELTLMWKLTMNEWMNE